MGPYDPRSFENRDPEAIARLVGIVERTVVPYHRSSIEGVERVPEGPALYVGNHNSATYSPDTYIMGAAVYRHHGIDAVPYGLAHTVVMQHPLINRLLCPLGAVQATPTTGEGLLSRGHKVLVYPGGDMDAMRPFRHRHRIVFGGRHGYARLAIKCGVPIVPMVAAGAHSTFYVVDDLRGLARLLRVDKSLRIKVWPLVLSFPWGLTLGPPLPHIPWPARISMEILEPIQFERSGAEAAADRAYVAQCAALVEGRMQASLDQLSKALVAPEGGRVR